MQALFEVDPKTLCAAMMEAAPDAIFLTDLNGVITLVNRQAERLFGYESSELLGQPIETLVPAEIRESHQNSRKRYTRAPRTRSMGEVGCLTGTRKDGSTVPVSVALSPLKSKQGHFIICTVRDETASRAMEEELRLRSTTDELTELYNRGYFEAELERIEAGRREPVSVIVADVDGLKPVNDLYGHAAGDALLRRTAAVLRTSFRGDDVIARVGGDEFAVLLPEVSKERLEETLRRLESDLVRHNDVYRGHTLKVSFGGATAERASGIREALKQADAAMYRKKKEKGLRASRSDWKP